MNKRKKEKQWSTKHQKRKTILPFQTYFWQSNMKCLPFWRSWVQLLCFGIEEMCTGYDRHQMMKILHLAIRLRWAKNNKENCLSHSYHLWYQNTVYNIWLILKCYIMEGSVLSFLKAEWKVSDTGSAHWASSCIYLLYIKGGFFSILI
jgi:hypothetical protein